MCVVSAEGAAEEAGLATDLLSGGPRPRDGPRRKNLRLWGGGRRGQKSLLNIILKIIIVKSGKKTNCYYSAGAISFLLIFAWFFDAKYSTKICPS